MALNNIVQGAKSSQNDLDQLVNCLNGTDSTSPVTVANRIQAQAVGATANANMIGGVFTKADPRQGSSFWPSSQKAGTAKAVSPSSSAGTYQTGDLAADEAGCFWIAVGNTSGTTPFINVGKAGDNMRTRASVKLGTYGFTGGGGAPLGPILDWRGWDWGGVQWDAINGFLIPATGFYLLTSVVHCTLVNSSVQFRVNWQYVIPNDFPDRTFINYGDQAQNSGNIYGDAGTTSEDIQLLTQGAMITPFVSASGSGARPIVGTAANDPTPDDYTLFAIVEFLGANPST